MSDLDALVDVVSEDTPDRIVVEPSEGFGADWDVSILITLAVAVAEDTDPEQLSP
ncbi:MAG: hypothetical protein ACOCQU_03260 [Halolamina sp.]